MQDSLSQGTFRFLIFYFSVFRFKSMQIVPAVTELLVAQFMWLDYDNPSKPIYLYINSPGTQVILVDIFLIPHVSCFLMLAMVVSYCCSFDCLDYLVTLIFKT